MLSQETLGLNIEDVFRPIRSLVNQLQFFLNISYCFLSVFLVQISNNDFNLIQIVIFVMCIVTFYTSGFF
jgi:hypothetical protein